MIFNMSGGGAALNFKVVGNPQPENPSENTIWINTDAEITGWAFSASEPENPVDGDVWITIGTASMVAFNALKNNSIMVYPMTAKQYIGGAWVGVTAKSYQGGAWVDWFPYLYSPGNECEDITGGWVCKAWQMSTDAGSATQTFNIARNGDNLTFTKTGQVGAVMHTANKIDLSNAKNIHFNGEMYPGSTGRWAGFFVWPDLNGRYWSSNAVKQVQCSNNTTKSEFTLDVSDLDGAYYIGFGIYHDTSKIVMEELYMQE